MNYEGTNGSITFSSVQFVSNTAPWGGAVADYSSNSSVSFRSCLFQVCACLPVGLSDRVAVSDVQQCARLALPCRMQASARCLHPPPLCIEHAHTKTQPLSDVQQRRPLAPRCLGLPCFLIMLARSLTRACSTCPLYVLCLSS